MDGCGENDDKSTGNTVSSASSLLLPNGFEKHLEAEEFVAGLGAGLINVAITFPIHKLMFRQMLDGVPTSSAFQQLRREGIYLLYRGLFPPLSQKAISVSIMFGSYDFYGSVIQTHLPILNKQITKSLGASLAGISEAIMTPFERLQTILQDRRYNKEFNNTLHATKHIWKEHGLTEFYRGCSPIIFRNSISNVIFFASREKAQHILPKPNSLMAKYLVDFASGGLIGAAISSAFYPVNVVKTRMQWKLGGPFEAPITVFRVVFNERDRKWSKMFRGVHLNYTRALLSWGIINASYELIKSLIHMYNVNDDVKSR